AGRRTPHQEGGHPAPRRALLEGSASAGLVAAAAGWGSAALRPNDANAADASPRQTAAFRMRQAAAQAYLDEPQPSHRSNGDEERYADKRASFAKTLPHNDAGEVDAKAFATFVSVLSSGSQRLRNDPARPQRRGRSERSASDLRLRSGRPRWRRDQPRPAAGLCQRPDGNRHGGSLLALADPRCAVPRL